MKKVFFIIISGLMFFFMLSGCNINVNDVINAVDKEGVGKAIQKIEVTMDSMSDSQRDRQEMLEKKTRDWTIMIYGSIDIEPQLEKALLQELVDMINIGNADNNIHLVAQIDYRKEKNVPSKRYYIEKGKLVVKGSFPNTNTGDPKTFEGFLRWAMSYPAKHRMLFVQGHGTGWISLAGPGSIMDNVNRSMLFNPTQVFENNNDRSFGYDNSDEDCITLTEASRVFKRVLGNKKLDILAFRSCLMDEVETAYQFSKYFNYLVATETTQVGIAESMMTAILGVKAGFDTYPLALLKERKGNVSPKELALAMYRSLKNTNEKILNSAGGSDHDFEIACLDLNVLKRIILPVKRISGILGEGLSYFSPYRNKLIDTIDEARSNAPKFGGMFAGMYEKEPNDYEYIDLGVFAQDLSKNLREFSKTEPGYHRAAEKAAVAASEITSILKESTLARSNTSNIEGSFAASIFLFPPKEKMSKIYLKLLENKYQELDFNVDSGWDKVVHNFYLPKRSE